MCLVVWAAGAYVHTYVESSWDVDVESSSQPRAALLLAGSGAARGTCGEPAWKIRWICSRVDTLMLYDPLTPCRVDSDAPRPAEHHLTAKPRRIRSVNGSLLGALACTNARCLRMCARSCCVRVSAACAVVIRRAQQQQQHACAQHRHYTVMIGVPLACKFTHQIVVCRSRQVCRRRQNISQAPSAEGHRERHHRRRHPPTNHAATCQ